MYYCMSGLKEVAHIPL